MKTIRIFIILIFISLQAGATGYVHNMFVAHKKLQSGKEQVFTKEKASAKVKLNVKPAKHEVRSSMFTTVSHKSTGSATLNERILQEGPSALFVTDNEDSSDESIVTKLVSAVKCVVYKFIASAKVGK